MSLAAKTLTAVRSNYIGTLIRVGAQFGAQLIIMRQLGPEQVGIFGYVVFAFGVLAIVVDQGFGWSLIHGDRSDEELRTVLSRIMLGSALGGVLVFVAAWPAAYLLGELAGSVFRWSAPAALLIAVWGISHARLRADMEFGKVQVAITASYIIATPVVGVTLALLGAGVWSLVGAWYVQAIVQVAISYYFVPFPLKLGNPFKSSNTAGLGRQVASINMLNWTVDNASGLTVGALGPAALGSFNAALMLSRTPALQLAATLQTVLFSAASSISSDMPRVRRMYLGALAVIAALTMPAYCYGLTHGDFIIGLVFGSKWADAGSAFAAMTIGMVALAMSALSSAVLTAIGSQGEVLRSQGICLGILLASLFLANQYGLAAVGAAISLGYVVRAVLQMRAISQRTCIEVTEFWELGRGPLTAAAVMMLPIGALAPEVGGRVVAEGLALAGQISVVIGLLWLFPRWFLSTPLRGVMQRFSPGLRLLRVVDR